MARSPRGEIIDLKRLQRIFDDFNKNLQGSTRTRIPTATSISGIGDKGIFRKLKKTFNALAKTVNMVKGALGGLGGFLMSMLNDLDKQFKLWKEGARIGLGFGGGTEGAQQGANVMSSARHYKAMFGIEPSELQSIMSQAIHSGMAASDKDLTGASGSRYERGLIEQVITTARKTGMGTGQVLSEGEELAKLGVPLEDVNQTLLEIVDSGREVGRAEKDHLRDVKAIQSSLRKYNMSIEIADGLTQAFSGALEKGIISTEAISSIFTGTTGRSQRGARAFVAERTLAQSPELAAQMGVSTGGFRGAAQMRSALEGAKGEDAQMAALRAINEQAKQMTSNTIGAAEGSEEWLEIYSQVMEENFGIQTANTLEGVDQMKEVIDTMTDPADKIGDAGDALKEYAENMPEEWRGSFEKMANLWSDTWDDTIGDLAWAESHFKSPIEKLQDLLELAKQSLMIILLDIAAAMDEKWFDGKMGIADMWTDEMRGSMVGSIGATIAQMVKREHGSDYSYDDLSAVEKGGLGLYSMLTGGFYEVGATGQKQTQESRDAEENMSHADATVIRNLFYQKEGTGSVAEIVGDETTATRGSIVSRMFSGGLSHLEDAGMWKGLAGEELDDVIDLFSKSMYDENVTEEELDKILGELTEVMGSAASFSNEQGLLTVDVMAQLEDSLHRYIEMMGEEAGWDEDRLDEAIKRFDETLGMRVSQGVGGLNVSLNMRTDHSTRTVHFTTDLVSEERAYIGDI